MVLVDFWHANYIYTASDPMCFPLIYHQFILNMHYAPELNVVLWKQWFKKVKQEKVLKTREKCLLSRLQKVPQWPVTSLPGKLQEIRSLNQSKAESSLLGIQLNRDNSGSAAWVTSSHRVVGQFAYLLTVQGKVLWDLTAAQDHTKNTWNILLQYHYKR